VQAAALLAARTYTVRPGDSLSSVAAKRCGAARDWTGIYAASRAHRWTARDANSVTAGQHLYLSCAYVPSMQRYAPAPRPVVRTAVVVYRAHGGTAYRAVSSGRVSTAGLGSFEACVITRESGGNSQVMNSSGHYGLFQFDYGTWVSGGGSGADFGHASAAEQDRVFAAVYASRGSEPWAPSDGC
jgi:Transglycosylase-like domain